MSRSGYSDDFGCGDVLELGRYRGQVLSAIRGKRGQRFIKELAKSLDEMPIKELHAELFQEQDKFCAIGVLGNSKGIDLSTLDPEDDVTPYIISDYFDIAEQLAREVMFENDNCVQFFHCDNNYAPHQESTPEFRWKYMRKWCDMNLNKD